MKKWKKVVSQREKDNQRIEVVVPEIEKLAKKYGVLDTRLACQRYALRTGEKLKLEREIKQREKELEALRKKK